MTTFSNARVRPAQAADYLRITEIHNGQNEPDHHVTPQQLRARDEKFSVVDSNFRRMVVELGAEVVATGTITSDRGPTARSDRRWCWLYTAEGHRGLGFDIAMLRHALDHDPGAVTEACACIRSDFLPRSEYIEAEGFEERYRSWGSHLDLRQFDRTRFDGLESRLEREGIRLESYEKLRCSQAISIGLADGTSGPVNGSRLAERLTGLQRELEEDAEHFDPIIPKRHADLQSADARPDTWILAVSTSGGIEHVMGMASLEGTPDRSTTHLGFVGVLPHYRNHGVGTALTAAVAGIARRMGFDDLNAGGGGEDTPMLSVLRKVGFDIEPAWVTLALELA